MISGWLDERERIDDACFSRKQRLQETLSVFVGGEQLTRASVRCADKVMGDEGDCHSESC